ncbi:MAG: hypothetical protein WCP43_03585 [Dehalococcoidia bacterium]|jgi:hypothetical protein
MNLQHLLQTAKELRQPSAPAGAEFEASRDGLAEELNRRMSVRPDMEKLIGSGNLAMMQDNSRNFCRFMSSMFLAYEPEVLAETALWVFRAYRSHGFKTTYWPANLDTFVSIARERLGSATFDELYPFFRWLIVNIPIFVKISDEQLADPISPEPSYGVRK